MIEKQKLTSLVFLLSISIAILGLDYFSKQQIENHLLLSESKDNLEIYDAKRIPLVTIGSAWNDQEEFKHYISFALNYIRNEAGIWGIFANIPKHIRNPLLNILAIIATGFVIFLLATAPLPKTLFCFALALILGGALGNLFDRLIYGYVIDWIDIHWKIGGWSYYFPNFNLADTAVSIGVAILIIDLMIEELRTKLK